MSMNNMPDEVRGLLGLEGDPRERLFFDELIRLAERAGLSDSQLYNAVGLNRSLWYRMRDDSKARTKKSNVLKMCVVLKLNFWEAFYLVSLAGYSFMPGADGTDRVVSECLLHGIHKPEDVDQRLEDASLETLFGEL